MRNIGLYIHIPFCISKCRYCDFYSIVSNESMRSIYIDRVFDQMWETAGMYPDMIIDTIYIGGGTPSVMSSEMMKKLFSAIALFNLKDNCEITMEINPGTIDPQKAAVMKRSGVNRISMGVQSMCDDELKVLGRSHDSRDVKTANRLMKKHRFENISMDLLFAFQSQSEESFKKTLSETVAMGPSHISAYPLKIEDGTEFGRLYKEGRLELFDEEIDRSMYHYMISFLESKGYSHYEISSFAKKGFESKHNLKYWALDEYIGIGVTAHSFINRTRYKNQDDLYSYINDPMKKTQLSRYTVDDMMKEYMMLGFRRINGICADDFQKKFGMSLYDIYKDRIDELKRRGLILSEGDRLYLSRIGLDYANQVFGAFL